MEIKKIIMTNNDCYKAANKMTPTGIVVHSTGANNPNLCRYIAPDDGLIGPNAYGNHWNQSGVSKCVHAMIGKDKNGEVRLYQTLPFDYKPWGCGSGTNGSYNNTHIQFEMLEDGLTDATYFNKVYDLAVEFCAYLCCVYNISIDKIVSHKEAHALGYASNHGDPENWLTKFNKTMSSFRTAVTNAVVDISSEITLTKGTLSYKKAFLQDKRIDIHLRFTKLSVPAGEVAIGSINSDLKGRGVAFGGGTFFSDDKDEFVISQVEVGSTGILYTICDYPCTGIANMHLTYLMN